MLIVETASHPVRRLFLKGPLAVDVPGESIAVEGAMLAEVTPLIRKNSPATRSPELMAYYPEEQFLLLEMVDGATLDSWVFGPSVRRAPRNLGDILRLCGVWLRRLHLQTQSPEEGNPFAWFLEELRGPSAEAVIKRCGGRELHTEVCDLASQMYDRHRTYRKPLCMVHGNFNPSHVLVRDDCIYVIDLAGSHMGYPYEDLAYFLTFHDIRMPWRRLIGAMRMLRQEQARHFLAGYSAGLPALTEPETLIMRLARLVAMARFVQFLEGPEHGTSGFATWVTWPWFRHRFREVCRQEVNALRRDARRRPGSGHE
jgi:aminoglycoside phosphotransferase (APT) family kinase protein